MGTALVETGSRMDEVIFEEFKGTGNMELRLDRGLADRRIYPAVDISQSGTRKEELLFDPSELAQVWKLRRVLLALEPGAALELLIDRLKTSKSNGEFLDEIVDRYEESGKPALTVLVPEEAFSEYGLSAVSPYEHEGKRYAVSGINIIDGQRILEEQEQEVVISRRPEAVFNVNSSEDLESAKNYLLNIKRDSKLNKES